jgi:hypothetical protein
MIAMDVQYRWPDLSKLQRRYLVRDDQGRYGLAHSDSAESVGAHPIEMPAKMDAPASMGLPSSSVLMTTTVWRLQADGTYRGTWCDYNGPTFPANIPPEMVRHLTIVDDLGYYMPDRWADIALTGSDGRGHWDYGATLGKIGGEPPVKGQRPEEMTIAQAVDYA